MLGFLVKLKAGLGFFVLDSWDAIAACDLRKPEVPVNGGLARTGPWTRYVHQSGCEYELYDDPQVGHCLQGAWLVLLGGSMSQIWTQQLFEMLAPGGMQMLKDDYSLGGETNIMDAIIENGLVVHKGILKDTSDPQAWISTIGHQNATFSPKRIRITNFGARFWDEVATPLEAITKAHLWSEADVTLVTSVGLWYVLSFGCNETWCQIKPHLTNLSMHALVKQHNKEMVVALSKLKPFCEQGGRAGVLGCAITDITHCDESQILTAIGHAARSTMAEKKTLRFRDVSVRALTKHLDEDCVAGHASPYMARWTWQALLGGICPGRADASGTCAQFQGPTCKASQFDRECGNWTDKGYHFPYECAIATPCQMVVDEGCWNKYPYSDWFKFLMCFGVGTFFIAVVGFPAWVSYRKRLAPRSDDKSEVPILPGGTQCA